MKRNPAFRLITEQSSNQKLAVPMVAGKFTIFPRVREITDAFGNCLKISVTLQMGEAVMMLEHPAAAGTACAMLNDYGVDVLASYIMAARLALPSGLPDERIDGHYPWIFRLTRGNPALLALHQDCTGRSFEIPMPFWDRLYAELCLIKAHIGERGRRCIEQLH